MKYLTEYIEITDSRYPAQLKQINKPPRCIYYIGNWDSGLFDTCVAIVGSRKISPYGRRCVEYFVKDFVLSGVTVVSGFMYGVDMCAHECAVANNGKTVAVLPHGIEIEVSESNLGIADNIINSGGLLVSMFDPFQKVAKWTFPARNEWVAGLSHSSVVIEAAKNSGSLITAGFAKKYNRPVFAVPGSIFSETSYGCNQLISNGARAAMISENRPNIVSDQKSTQISKVFEALKTGTFSQDELFYILNMSYREISVELANLLMSKRIYESGGRFYVY